LDYVKGYPPLINDVEVADVVRRCAEAAVGKERVFEPEPSMGGEDMAYFLERSKGCYFFLGVGREGCASLHNSRFDFNEEALLSGIETFCRIAWELLK
ncbi:MAG TPA: M20/M25/M40 family metallo-hydrolase, partial [Deltaproteobacteria bacterium]|nr:M20/M25/M40 family metallo-hydrolase [Deltaproteobacteria bacterium]